MKIFIVLFFSLLPAYAADIVPNVSISTSARSVNEIYRPIKTRDPLIQSSVYSSKTDAATAYEGQTASASVQVSTAAAAEFSVLGIMEFYGNKEALLKDKNGNTFICKDGRIYDSRKKSLQGWKCDIKGKQISVRDPKGNLQKFLLEK